jgi:flavin reductase (DIM6/NTAB) family NADH-FMN oxidoreductase RutF
MEKIISAAAIQSMERFRRRTLMNQLTGFKGLHLIGTQNMNGITNLGLFSNVIHIGANPGYIGFILRPLTVPRHTYENLKSNSWFTLNLVNETMLDAAHQASAKYEGDISEFEECGFTPQYTDLSKAPYVKEASLKLACTYQEEHRILANDTVLVVGKVEEILLPEEVLQEDGFIDLTQLNLVASVGLDAYYTTSFHTRKEYARPSDQKPKLRR